MQKGEKKRGGKAQKLMNESWDFLPVLGLSELCCGNKQALNLCGLRNSENSFLAHAVCTAWIR